VQLERDRGAISLVSPSSAAITHRTFFTAYLDRAALELRASAHALLSAQFSSRARFRTDVHAAGSALFTAAAIAEMPWDRYTMKQYCLSDPCICRTADDNAISK